jgi:hypothetical protein
VITLLDQDIAHIARMMWLSLCEDRGGPVLRAGYWRRRIHLLLNSTHLTKIQLRAIDDLLLQLDRFDVKETSSSVVDDVIDNETQTPSEHIL